MARNEKRNRKQRTGRRDLLRGFPLGLLDLSDLRAKLLPCAVLYVAGAAWIWGKRAAAREALEGMALVSPILKGMLEHIFPAYLLLGAGAVLLVMVYPFGRKAAEDDLRRAGLTNHEGEAPRLLRKRRDGDNPNITVWEFDNRGVALSEWEDRRARVEAALDLNVIKMEYGKGKRRVLVYAAPAKTSLPDILPWRDKHLSPDSFVLTLGESLLGPVTVNLAHIPHILLGGSTGSGKSVLLKLLLMQSLKKGAVVCIADFKGGVDFPKVWHDKCRMCFEETALPDMLDMLLDALEARKRLFRGVGCSNLDEYIRATGDRQPRYIFACDEVAELLDRTGADSGRKKRLGQIESKLTTIARLGRAFGIHLILATQRPDANIIPGQIRNNLDFRVCGKAEKTLSQIILDNTAAAEQIPKDARGRFILHDGTIFQAYWLDEGCL